MSSKKTVRNLSSGKAKPDTRDSEESGTRNAEDKKTEVPGVHRFGPTDMERHFGKDGTPDTAEKRPTYADVHLPIDKTLWQQVQIAASRQSIQPWRYVEMALQLALKSEK